MNEQELFCTKKQLLVFKILLYFPKLNFIGEKTKPNSLTFSKDILVDIQSVTFLLLLSNVNELSIGEKTKKLW